MTQMTGFELFDKSDKFHPPPHHRHVSMLVLVRLIYFRIYRRKIISFNLFRFNIIIFIITYLLNKVDMSMGAAFGLFAASACWLPYRGALRRRI